MAGFNTASARSSGSTHIGNGTGVRGPTNPTKTNPLLTASGLGTKPSWVTGAAVPATKDGLSNLLLGDIKSVYSQGPLGLSTYAGLGATTNQGLASLIAAANNAQGSFNGALNYATDLVGKGGLSTAQRQAINNNTGLTGAYAALGDNAGLTGLQSQNLKQTNSLYGAYGKLGDNNGQSAGQTQTLNAMNGVNGQFGKIAGSLAGPSAAQTGYTGLYNSAGGPSLTEQQLLATAQGKNLDARDPYFQANLDRTLNDAASSINASVGASGRAGSNLQTQALGSSLGSISDQARSNEYNNALARQQQALSAIEGQRQQGFTNQFNALGASDQARLNQINTQMGALGQQQSGLNSVFGNQQTALGNQFAALAGQGNTANNAFNMGQQGVANQFNALAGRNTTNQNAFNMGQQGINNAMTAGNNLASLYQNTLLPGQTKLTAGQLQDADAQAKLNDANNIKNKDFNYLSQYLGLLGGAQPDKEKSNPLLDLLGVGGSLASLFL